MAIQTYKQVIISADTRTTELFMSLISGAWSIWVLCVDHNISPRFMEVMHRTGGFLVWGTWPAINCIMQIFAIYYKYPKLRAVSAAMCAMYWLTIAYTIFRLEPTMFTPWMASIYAIIQLWILLHRTAAPLSE